MFTRERVISYYITTTLFTTTFHVGTIHINDNLPRVSSISATFHIVRLREQSKSLVNTSPAQPRASEPLSPDSYFARARPRRKSKSV